MVDNEAYIEANRRLRENCKPVLDSYLNDGGYSQLVTGLRGAVKKSLGSFQDKEFLAFHAAAFTTDRLNNLPFYGYSEEQRDHGKLLLEGIKNGAESDGIKIPEYCFGLKVTAMTMLWETLRNFPGNSTLH